ITNYTDWESTYWYSKHPGFVPSSCCDVKFGNKCTGKLSEPNLLHQKGCLVKISNLIEILAFTYVIRLRHCLFSIIFTTVNCNSNKCGYYADSRTEHRNLMLYTANDRRNECIGFTFRSHTLTMVEGIHQKPSPSSSVASY
ncbi:unnamed protein product, partial [Soboliphyme baturini]|uniref:Glycoprotein n=1 Tax=Soboliphyme baturini TaxID=241478 RepID=A0A183J8G2_9BILA